MPNLVALVIINGNHNVWIMVVPQGPALFSLSSYKKRVKRGSCPRQKIRWKPGMERRKWAAADLKSWMGGGDATCVRGIRNNQVWFIWRVKYIWMGANTFARVVALWLILWYLYWPQLSTSGSTAMAKKQLSRSAAFRSLVHSLLDWQWEPRGGL